VVSHATAGASIDAAAVAVAGGAAAALPALGCCSAAVMFLFCEDMVSAITATLPSFVVAENSKRSSRAPSLHPFTRTLRAIQYNVDQRATKLQNIPLILKG
jgi:hypothetical protein